MEVAIKDLGEIITGNTPSKKEESYWDSNDICFVKPDGIADDGITLIRDSSEYLSENARMKARIVSKDSVFVTCIGSIGKIGIASDGDYAFNQQINVVVPNEKVLPRYLAYNLLFSKPRLEAIANAPVVPIINKTQFGDFMISIEESTDKQEQIVGTLDKLSGIVCSRKAELEELDKLIKARFVEMFGVPIDNTRDWPMNKAENLCTLVTDGSHFSPKACDKGYPMLSVKDMGQNGFDYSNCKFVDDDTFEVLKKQGCVPNVDDVLIAKDGSYFTRAFVISEYKDQAILSSIGIYRPNKKLILPRFLASYLMTDEVREFVNRGYVTGTALRRVIIKGLKAIPVYTPPIDLQEEFVQFVQQVDKSKVVA